MTRSSRLLALLIILAGIVAVAMGITYIAQGVIKSQYLSSAMQQEQITLGIESEQLEEGEVIDTAKEAEIAGDTIRAHRRSIAPTYGALLGDEQYDPSNPQHLTYAQALNLENYLYLAVLGFGVTTVVITIGIFMIVVGCALVAAGILLRKVALRFTAAA